MKKFRIISLILAIAMLCPLFASCSSDVQATVNIKFIVVNKETGEKTTILERNGYTIVAPEAELTALNAAIKILQEFEVTYSLTADNHSIAQVREYVNEDTLDETTGYYSYWNLYLDGQRNTSGRMSTVAIYEGANIEFIFEHGQTDRQDTDQEETTNQADYETETEAVSETETEPEE